MSNGMDRLIPEVRALTSQFDYTAITAGRKERLDALADLLRQRWNAGEDPCINFICTHNSRRSLMAQVWGQTAAMVYGLVRATCLSGGTEVIRIAPATIKAFERAGFYIRPPEDKDESVENPIYRVYYSRHENPVLAYSKRYDDPVNTAAPFTAVMTCADAEEACPVVHKSAARFFLPYDDPGAHDGTAGEHTAYDECLLRIGREMFYVFSRIK